LAVFVFDARLVFEFAAGLAVLYIYQPPTIATMRTAPMINIGKLLFASGVFVIFSLADTTYVTALLCVL
jgi:hypothetical protein